MSTKILVGEAAKVLRTIDDDSVDCVITSPPYWGLRDYGVIGQLGHEPTFSEYVEKLVVVFDEVKRVLKDDGTCWVNLGDTYGTQSGAMRDGKFGKKNTNNQQFTQPKGIHKSLCQIPSRFALAMTERGWILRNHIIWHKPNVMPSSASDRFTVDFEDVFFFVKNKKYFFRQQFDPYAPSSDVRYRQAIRAGRSYLTKEPYKGNTPYSKYKRGEGSVPSRGDDADGLVVGGSNPKGRNRRTVWSIPTKPFKGAHFATFPEALVEPMILAGCPVDGTILDPFSGAATTGVVAKRLGCNFIGIELNPEYAALSERRLAGVSGSLFEKNI